MKDKIKWPAGNRLDLCIPLRKITVKETGTQFGEYVPSQAAVVMVYLVGNYASYEFTPRIEDNKLYISDNGELKPGVYAIDVRIQEPERQLRSFRCGELEIVRETKQLALGDFVLDNNITLDADAFIFGEGPSAYEVAVRDGYTGTKAEWLESLRGKEGRGIADIVSLPTGAFRILLTDGSAYVTPTLKGEQGVSIVDFAVSSITSQEVICTVTMSDGTTRQLNLPRGEQGAKGDKGDDGQDGRGIQSIVLNADYTLTFNYTDGTTYTTPQSLRGEKGENGQDGQDGRGISSMSLDDDSHLTVSYTDGTTFTTPQSLQGERGVSITDFEQVGESATMTFFNIYYSNGNISQIGLPKGEQGDRGEQGPQGPKGDTVVLGEVGEYKLYNVAGSATDGAMTQDATTKAIAANTGYYECGTAAGTAAKVAVGDNEALYTLQKGGSIKVKMKNANAAASGVTLKIGSAAATPLYYNGEAVSASNTWEAGEVVDVYYDGSVYQASNAQGGGGKAERIKFNNSASGLAAENVQGALDESLKFKKERKVIVPKYLDTKNGFLATDGTWRTPVQGRLYTHKSLSVVAGEWYKITAKEDTVTTFAFLQSDQVPSTNQQPIDLVSGTSVNVVDAGKTKYVHIPEGCTTLAINEAYVISGDRLPSKLLKVESIILNDKIEEIDYKIDDTSIYDNIPIPYNIKVYIPISTKTWLVGNNNYTGSFIYIPDSALKYKISANADYSTRIVALTNNTYTSGEDIDTFATGEYDSSEFCVNAGETRIVKFPAATKFLWISFTEGSGINTTPQYIGMEKVFEMPEMYDEVCLFTGSTQATLEIPCQITAGDILHIEVDKGDTSPYTTITTKYNDVVQEYLDYMCTNDVDKYFVARSNADVIRMFSSIAASSFKVSKVQASLLKDIEFSEICNNLAEVAIQNGTPVPYYMLNSSGEWVTGAQYKSYILDIPDGAVSMYIVPHGSCTFAFLNSNTLPVSPGAADLFGGIPRIAIRNKTEYVIPSGCKYVAFTYYFYNNRIVTDASPIYLGFKFSSVDFLNKYKLAQPYSSLGLENMHLIIAAETLYQNNTDKTHSTNLSIMWPWIVRTKHANALGKYYLYFSEDHTQDSPIYMSYSDNLLDWTYYGIVATELGLLGTAGDIECPCVIWDDFNSRYLLYTHALGDIAGVGYAQTEFICESTDGINWTYVKPFVTIPKDRFVGNFHNGYVRIQKDGGRWYASGLIGGGDAGQSTDYFSYDGLNWVVNPKQVCPKAPMCKPYTNGNPTDMREIVLRGGDFFVIDGKHYYISNGGTSASGTDERVARIYIQETLDDNRTCLGKAYPLTYENQAIRTVTSFMDDSGEVYVMLAVKYTPFGANHKRPFYIFIAKLKKN